MSNKFTFEYDATTGVLIAAALRETAKRERDQVEYLQKYFAGQGVEQAENLAKLFEDAAEAIHAPVRAALAADMGEALRKAGIVE